jgi:hypothetical protein
MPFKLRVSKVEHSSSEIKVTGELLEGAFRGPESILLCDRSGRWVSSQVIRHGVMLMKDWPVVPGDGSRLLLYIASPSPDFELDAAQPILGQGNLATNANRLDISNSLSEPAFWMLQLWLHIGSEQLPDPSTAWGFSQEDATKEYARLFEQRWKTGIWPFVRIPVSGSRYVEIEYAASVEYQTRVWIGEDDGPRVLLGYDSGHFSFPSLRVEEVLALADRITIHPSLPLLLLPGAYATARDALPADKVTLWLQEVPGIKTDLIALIVAQLLKKPNPKLQWTCSPPLGWTNNGKYSQRNPESPMSILTRDDFGFIQDFFSQDSTEGGGSAT